LPEELVTALALVLVIEGVLYALFPSAMRRAVAAMLEQPAGRLRVAGLIAAALGVGIVWMMRG
jgi:uncharacterized protein